MGRRDTAFRALMDRVSAATARSDLGLLVAPEASRDADDLAAATDPGADLDAAAVLGLFHWCRFLHLQASAPASSSLEEERRAALGFFAPVYRVAPQSVPELARDQFLLGRHDGIAVDPAGLNDRAIDLAAAYRRGGDVGLLDAAVLFLRAAVHAVAGDGPGRAVYLSNLAALLRAQFERSGDADRLKEATVLGRAAVDATSVGSVERASALSNLSGVLQRLFERTADVAALAEAVQASLTAVQILPAEHAGRSVALSNLRGALLASFAATSDVNSLNLAVDAARAAADATPSEHPDRAANLSNLAITLKALSARTSDEGLLAEAVEACREAVRITPDGHPDRVRYLSNLGMTLRSLYERTGNDSLLPEAVAVGRAAADAMPADHPDRAIALSSLGAALYRLFERTGDVAVLADAIVAGRASVAAAPRDHPELAKWLSNLGIALIRLYERGGDVELLQEAVEVCRAAVGGVPPGLPERALYASNLGAALRTLFERTGDVDLLVEAVEFGRLAVDATPDDHPDRAARLSNLASAVRAMADRDDDVAVAAEAVKVARMAVDAIPAGHSEAAPALSNLGIALRVLSERTGDDNTLANAVDVGRWAVDATAEDHPDRAVWFVNLAGALRALSERTGDVSLAEEANDRFAQAAANEAAAVTTRIHAYRNVARYAMERGRAEQALSALEAAVDLAQLLAPRSLARPDREHRLGRVAGLAGDAAAAAVAAGRPARAVELLEQARGILMAHRFDISDDVGRLRDEFPDLADAVDEVRDRLDGFDSAPPRVHDSGAGSVADQRAVSAARRAARAEWERLLTRIRALDRYSDFLRAPRIEQLTAQAAAGPVVFLFTSDTHSGALILTGSAETPVKEVVLTNLTRGSANQRAVRLVDVQREALLNDDAAVRENSQRELFDHLAWIWDAITGPVLEALGHARTPVTARDWSRIWWCPIGILAYLPLHASGHHADTASTSSDPDRRANPRTVLDRVVSSYTPTVRSLASARVRIGESAAPGIAIIAAPSATEDDALPRAAAEVHDVAALVPHSLLLADPTRDAVLDVLPRYAATHFAGHGVADINDPAASRLILSDYDTAPLTVADIAARHLSADLAYLSACDTTLTSLLLADEAVHLTGAFHLAGYRHVIGTAWPVNDSFAGKVAKAFYGRLTDGGAHSLDAKHCARALHDATRRLRTRYPSVPAAWAAYTHTGI